MKNEEPIDFAKIKSSIYRWLVDVAEIVPEAIWERQNVTQPEYPYASMLVISGPRKEGGRDELRTSFDALADDGAEISLITTGPRQITVAISFHVDGLDASRDPNNAASSLAARAQSSLGQSSVLDHLRESGIAVVAEEGVTDTSVVINGKWLSRATLDVRLRVTSVATETTGYIGSVELQSDELGVDDTFDLEQ